MHRVYAILAFISWVILLWPFPGQAFLAACLSCLILPLYRRLLDTLERRYAIACVALLLVLGIALPLTALALMVTPQAMNGLKAIDNLQKSGWFQGAEFQALLDSVDVWVCMVPGMEKGVRALTSEVAALAGGVLRTTVAGGLGIAGSTMSLLLRLFMLVVLTLVGILYAPTFFRFAQLMTRFPTAVLERFTRAIRSAIRSVLVGVVLVAVLQGILCGVGFAFTGVPAASFWGMVAALVAPMPIIGTGVVWLPVCMYLWFGVSKTAALGLALWCTLAVVGCDNFLRPLFLRGGLNAPFSVVLIAIICGLIAFGPVGIVAGPVLAAFALQAAREAERNRQSEHEDAPW